MYRIHVVLFSLAHTHLNYFMYSIPYTCKRESVLVFVRFFCCFLLHYITHPTLTMCDNNPIINVCKNKICACRILFVLIYAFGHLFALSLSLSLSLSFFLCRSLPPYRVQYHCSISPITRPLNLPHPPPTKYVCNVASSRCLRFC